MNSLSSPEQDVARVRGAPGSGAQAWGMWKALAPMVVVWGAMAFALGAALQPRWLRGAPAGAVLLALSVLLLVLYHRAGRKLSRHWKGAKGEEAVAARLAQLPSGWSVYHSLPFAPGSRLGGRDLDHLLLGPPGLVVVETKNWDGIVRVEQGRVVSRHTPIDPCPLHQVASSAEAVSGALRERLGFRLPVTPLLCFVSATLWGGRQCVEEVHVCEEGELLSLLQHLPTDAASGRVYSQVREVLDAWFEQGGL